MALKPDELASRSIADLMSLRGQAAASLVRKQLTQPARGGVRRLDRTSAGDAGIPAR
jgi:hypothetical protein